MKKLFFTVILTFALLQISFAQQIINRDPLIFGVVTAISQDSLQKHVEALVAFHTRHNLSTQTNPAQGIKAAADYIYRQCAAYAAKMPERMSVTRIPYTAGGEGTRLGSQVTLENIEVCILFGSKADSLRTFMSMAHFDSRSQDNTDGAAFAPGANDDGSGIAALLEMVRLFAQVPADTYRNAAPCCVKLLFLSGEEHGLLGAHFMAEKAKQGKWKIEAIINNDMIGNSSSSETELRNNMRVRIFAGENEGRMRELGRYVKEVGERYVDQLTVQLMFRNDRFGRGGDHTPFNQRGFAAVRMTEYNENYDRTHQITRTEPDPARPGKTKAYGDVVSGVDFDYVRKNAGANLAVLLNLALAPAPPVSVTLHTGTLSNQSRLSWTLSADPSATASSASAAAKLVPTHYLLMRETDQPQWTRKIRIQGTEITVPYSKDNYFFAIQSVDVQGHESMIVGAK